MLPISVEMVPLMCSVPVMECGTPCWTAIKMKQVCNILHTCLLLIHTALWYIAPSEENAESLFERYKMWLPWGAGAVALILLCCITNCVVIIAVCVYKRKKSKALTINMYHCSS